MHDEAARKKPEKTWHILILTIGIAILQSLRGYGAKIFGKGDQSLHGPKLAKRSLIVPSAISLAGSLTGIAAIGFVTAHFSVPLLLAPFGASVVLLFSVYDSPLAQPRNTFFGHVIAALIAGIIAIMHISYFGSGSEVLLDNEQYIWIAMAVSLAIFAMQVLRLTHPPAGATAFIASTTIISLDSFIAFMVSVIAGSLILIAMAVIFNNAAPKRRYPVYW
ncbi:MAG: HPP family protein [Thermoproteota archaeon]